VHDFSHIAALVRSGDAPGLARLIRSGWDVDQRQDWTANTALLLACDADQEEVAALLLAHGADPNAWHNDGYNCYDSTRLRNIKRLLVAHGFSLRRAYPRYGRGMVARRMFDARTPITDAGTMSVTGTEVFVEHRVTDFPAPSGRMRLSAAVSGLERYTDTVSAPGHRVHRLTPPGAVTDAVEVTVRYAFEEFLGEARIRLYCAATIAANAGPREFWLPDLATDGAI
jgi:hypothetical protein